MADGKWVRHRPARAPFALFALFVGTACADRAPNVVVDVRPTLVPARCDGVGVRRAAGSWATLGRGSVTVLDTTPELAGAGDNRWRVLVRDPREEPVSGAFLSLTAFMPVHGHASPKVALSLDEGDGAYLLSPVALSMPGVWLVDLTVTSDPAAGRATFYICVGPLSPGGHDDRSRRRDGSRRCSLSRCSPRAARPPRLTEAR
jgi:hypothetical protein